MNAAPTSVMNGLSHVCGAYASVAVITGGSAAMARAYCVAEKMRSGSNVGATAASADRYTIADPSTVRLNSPRSTYRRTRAPAHDIYAARIESRRVRRVRRRRR